MANRITISNPTPSDVPLGGYTVGYRILGTTGAYTIVTSSTMPITINTADAAGTLYEGYVERNCGGSNHSTDYFWQTPCSCVGTGYSVAVSGKQCKKVDTVNPTVSNSGYCLAPSTNSNYSNYGTRVYRIGFNDTTIGMVFPTVDANIVGTSTTNGQWANISSTSTGGPMNRDGVWIDTNCDGARDALTAGSNTTVAYVYNNTTGANKLIHIGIAGDNQFSLVVNGTTIATTGSSTPDIPFKIWHIFPYMAIPGTNFINAIATGDGSVDDAIALVVYDNTAAEILSAASDAALNIPFRSGSLRGTSFDVATCPATYSLDTTGGSGNYICVKTTYKGCNTLT